MRHSIRILLLLALLAAVVFLPALALRGPRMSEASQTLLRLPTTQTSDHRSWLFTPMGRPPFVIVAPATWYGFGSGIGTSFSFAGDISTGRVMWKVHLRAVADPARGEGTIFVPTQTPEIVALDELSRAVIWRIATPEPLRQIFWDDGVLVALGQKSMYGFEPANGKRLWSVDAGGTIETLLAVANGRACLGISGIIPPDSAIPRPFALVAFKSRTGESLWRTSLTRPPAAAPAFDGDTIYCSAHDLGYPWKHTLVAVDAKSGRLKWEAAEFATGRDHLMHPPRTPAAGDGIVCATLDNLVCGFDANTGQKRWQWTNSNASLNDSPYPIGPPIIRDGIAYVGIDNGVCGLEARTGRELWRYEKQDGGGAPDPQTPPKVAGNVVFIPFRMGTMDVVRLPGSPPVFIASSQLSIRPIAASLGALLLIILFCGALYVNKLRALIALISLLLGAVALQAWMTDYTTRHFIGVKQFATAAPCASETTCGITSTDGALTIGRRHIVWETSIARSVQGDRSTPFWWARFGREVFKKGACLEEPPADLGMTHFAWTHRSRPSGTNLGDQSETSLTLPHWFVVAVLAVPPFAWLGGFWRDRRRYPKGHCIQCGYDLRASKNRCPECGHPFRSTAK